MSSDPFRLGYGDVDADRHASVLVANMDATGQWPATQRLRAWEREQLGLIDGERLLDVGCGPGDAAIALAADLGSSGTLVGIDTSAVMLDAARRRSAGLPCRVRFSVGDARSSGEPDDFFDVVRSERTLQWLRDPEVAVAEFTRVLRPGGRLSLIDTDWSTLELDVGDPVVTAAVRDGLRDERHRASNVGHRLVELVSAAGLDVAATRTETHVWTEWDPDTSPSPDGCFSMTSLAEDLAESDRIGRDAVERFVDTVHGAARDGRFSMALTMHAVVGVLP